MIASFLACVVLNPYAGSYTGQWRCGFLNYRPATLAISPFGAISGEASGVPLSGTCKPDGKFVIVKDSETWTGQFTIVEPVLLGRFIASPVPLRGDLVLWKR